MSKTFTTEPIKQVLTYPFKDEKWQGKVIIGILISLGNFIIPILPALFVWGYFYQIMHRILVGDGELYLPEWDDWGKLLKDGWRLFCVNFLYNIPALIIMFIGVGIYFVGIFGFAIASSESYIPEESMLVIYPLMGIMFLCMAVSMVLVILVTIALPPAMCNAVKHDSFKAAFQLKEWWQVLKANVSGFIIALLLGYGLFTIIMFVGQLLYMSMICCCLMYPVAMIGGYYLGFVFAALIPLVYKEGLEKLEA